MRISHTEKKREVASCRIAEDEEEKPAEAER